MDMYYIVFLMTSFFFVVWLLVALTIYFMPVIVAYIRKHNNIAPIAIMNFFIGWTFLGWIAALLWSLNGDVEKNED